ncbi:hypothetical protein ACEPAH_3379 [Sanghuangporus vaninii]
MKTYYSTRGPKEPLEKRRMQGEAAYMEQRNERIERERRDEEKKKLKEQLPFIWLGSQNTSYDNQETEGPARDKEVDEKDHGPRRLVETQGSSSNLGTERTKGGYVPPPRGHKEHKKAHGAHGGKVSK